MRSYLPLSHYQVSDLTAASLAGHTRDYPHLQFPDAPQCYNEAMPHQRKLTYKQEGYAQDRASGLTQSAAYRNNYDTRIVYQGRGRGL